MTAKVQAKAEREAIFEDAAQAHRRTTGLPGRRSTFHIAAAPEAGKLAYTYTGKDVRKAVFDGHMEAQRLKRLGGMRKSPLKDFWYCEPEVPKPHGGDRPLLHTTVGNSKKCASPGREFPLPNYHEPAFPSPARAITQKTARGHYMFKGVIAHDQSRTQGAGYQDHFQVKEWKLVRTWFADHRKWKVISCDLFCNFELSSVIR